MYYVIEVATGDSKIAGKAIYEYATYNEAVATFHQKMATSMKSEMYTTELVMVVDKYGTVIERKRFEREADHTDAEIDE